jgi:hypothetical protein
MSCAKLKPQKEKQPPRLCAMRIDSANNFIKKHFFIYIFLGATLAQFALRLRLIKRKNLDLNGRTIAQNAQWFCR